MREDVKRLIKDLHDTTSAEMDKRILEDTLKELERSERAKSALVQPNIWRIIMKSRMTKLAAAAVIITAVVVSITFLDKSVASAYAVEQTINAMKAIRTVYMTGEFYKQGKFECWMKFDGDPDKPTHIWLGQAGHNLCKICSPEGVFGLNKRTKAVYFAQRDERGKDWVIKFGSFFEDIVRQAQMTDSIQICSETDPNTQKKLTAIYIETANREQKFLVDPETKLPISFSTVREDLPMEMMKKTVAVKNLEYIVYNEEPPKGIFEMPADARIVGEVIDCMVDSDCGLIADGMSREEACLEIVRQIGKALVELDIPKLKRFALYYRIFPEWMWGNFREKKQNGQWVIELSVIGGAYQQGDLWYVPCKIVDAGGKTEFITPMIKFYEMEGHTYCFIIGSKEKGVVKY